MSIVAIVQARMGSSRYPGKVLHRVAGKPMLGYLLERLDRCRGLGGQVVATSSDPTDDPIAGFCAAASVPCFRGDLVDVAGRYLAVLDAFPCEAFARINGDSPLLDPAILETALDLYRQGGCDLACNVHPRTFPKGQSVEVIATGAFRRAYPRMRGPEEREHVTLHFYRNERDYRISNFISGGDLNVHQLSVDTPADMAAFEGIVAAMSGPHWGYGYREVLELRARLTGSAKGEIR